MNHLITELLFPLLIFTAMASKDFRILDYLPLIGGALLVIIGFGLIAWGVAKALGYNPHAFIPPMMFHQRRQHGPTANAFCRACPCREPSPCS